MKKWMMASLLMACLSSQGQVMVGHALLDDKSKLYEKNLNQFKQSTTVFLLPESIHREVYDKILKEVWTVTPYVIANPNTIDLRYYIDEKYSFVMIDGLVKSKETSMGANVLTMYAYFDFFTFDMESKRKELEKLQNKSDKKKEKHDIFRANRQRVGAFYLYPNAELVKDLYKIDIEEFVKKDWPEKNYHNFMPGLLRNYFQAINNGLVNAETLNVHDEVIDSELKNLSSKTLYVPNSVKIKFRPGVGKLREEERDEEDMEDLFAKYEYKYEFLDDAELDAKILRNEAIYYLRYVRQNNIKYINVVNAQTGKIIYQERTSGLNYNLKSGNLKDLSQAIKKAK